jgi:predicted amidohydrolase
VKNYEIVADYAAEAQASGADLLILPEMFSTGFSLNPQITAETKEGPTLRFLTNLARNRRLHIIAGVALEAPRDRARNTAIVIDDRGREVALYTKMQLFSFVEEEKYHVRGTAPIVFPLFGLNCTCFICYDLRFPSLFRSVNHRCEVYFVIASWPATRQRHWDVLLQARAVENQAYVVGVNRIGKGGGLSYTGGSRIFDPLGDEIANASSDERLIFCDIDKNLVRKIRKEMPFLKDRRHPTLP